VGPPLLNPKSNMSNMDDGQHANRPAAVLSSAASTTTALSHHTMGNHAGISAGMIPPLALPFPRWGHGKVCSPKHHKMSRGWTLQSSDVLQTKPCESQETPCRKTGCEATCMHMSTCLNSSRYPLLAHTPCIIRAAIRALIYAPPPQHTHHHHHHNSRVINPTGTSTSDQCELLTTPSGLGADNQSCTLNTHTHTHTCAHTRCRYLLDLDLWLHACSECSFAHTHRHTQRTAIHPSRPAAQTQAQQCEYVSLNCSVQFRL